MNSNQHWIDRRKETLKYTFNLFSFLTLTIFKTMGRRVKMQYGLNFAKIHLT